MMYCIFKYTHVLYVHKSVGFVVVYVDTTDCKIMDVASMTSLICLWTAVLKPQVWILAAAILFLEPEVAIFGK